jgi:hypothetical protein
MHAKYEQAKGLFANTENREFRIISMLLGASMEFRGDQPPKVKIIVVDPQPAITISGSTELMVSSLSS